MLNLDEMVFDWLPAGRILPSVFSEGRPSRTHDATVPDGDYYWVLFVRDRAFQWEVTRFHGTGALKGYPALWVSDGDTDRDAMLEQYGSGRDLEEAKAAAEVCFKDLYRKVHQ